VDAVNADEAIEIVRRTRLHQDADRRAAMEAFAVLENVVRAARVLYGDPDVAGWLALGTALGSTS
jgi:hypothetical protein